LDRLRFSTAGRPRRRRPPRFVAILGQRGFINALAIAFGLLLLGYLYWGSVYWAALLVLVAGFGVDQALRSHPQGDFRDLTSTAIYLFVPVLFALGSALFLREVSEGAWNLLSAAVAAGLFALAAQAEYLTIDVSPATYPGARFALSLVSYLTAFALFVIVFTSDLRLPVATLIVAVTALLLTVDILRELEVQTGTLFAYAAAVAAVVAEVRWVLYYLAPPDLLAGALVLLAFYLLTGLIQSYLSGHLDRRSVAEFGVVGVVGVAVISAAWLVSERV
jgi:hypothetical protein